MKAIKILSYEHFEFIISRLKSLGFDVIMRPKHQGNSNTEIEILLKYDNKSHGSPHAMNVQLHKLHTTLEKHMVQLQ